MQPDVILQKGIGLNMCRLFLRASKQGLGNPGSQMLGSREDSAFPSENSLLPFPVGGVGCSRGRLM